MTAVWPFATDWTNGYSEFLEWKTAVLESRTGAEQRYSVRVGPRRMMDIPFIVFDHERSYFDAQMMMNAGRPWYAPLPHETVTLPPVEEGQAEFPFDTAYRELRSGGTVILRGDSFHAEVLEVASVFPTGVTTTTGAIRPYGQGCTITPAVLAFISDKVSLTRRTSRAFSGTVRFTALEPVMWPMTARDPKATLAYPPLPADKPFPILTQEPNSVNDLSYVFARMLEILDDEAALPVYTDKAQRGFSSQSYEWFLNGARERSDFKDLLFVLRGQRGALWVPTFNDDLSPGGAGYPNPQGFDVQPGRENAVVFGRDGTIILLSTGPQIADGGIPPYALESADVFRVSFASLKRLEQDSVEIVHMTDLNGLATVSLTLRDAPNTRQVTGYVPLPYPRAYKDQVGGGSIPAVNVPIALNAPVVLTGPAGGQP